MSKISSKENKNLYFKKREELGLTREEAYDLLESMPPERIEKIENERCIPHPDEVLLMAEKYKCPDLCNYFCSHQCEIGKQYVPEVKIKDLSSIILNMVASLNSVQKSQDNLIEIASDGSIQDNELEEFVKIQNELEKISIAVEALQLWSEQKLSDGTIDKEKYDKIIKKKK